MELLLKRTYPSEHVWEGGDGKWRRYTVSLSVYRRHTQAYELRIETGGCQGQPELQRFRSKSVGEFVPLAIKECLVPLDTFRDFVYMAQDKEEGTEPMMFNENFKERPHLEEGYQDSYYYEVLGEHAAWAFGLNREGGAWDARSNTLYTAQEIASMKEFYQKEYESDVV